MGIESVLFVQIAALLLWLLRSTDVTAAVRTCDNPGSRRDEDGDRVPLPTPQVAMLAYGEWTPWRRYLRLLPRVEEITCLLSFQPEEAAAWLQLPELKVNGSESSHANLRKQCFC